MPPFSVRSDIFRFVLEKASNFNDGFSHFLIRVALPAQNLNKFFIPSSRSFSIPFF